MNLILIFPDDFTGENLVRIRGERLSHIRNVLNAKEGDFLSMGILNGPMGKGFLKKREKDADIFEIDCTLPPPAPLPLSLIVSLPRPKVFRRILESMTSLGVKEIIFLHSFRVEKSYWQSPFLGEEAMNERIYRGLEQAKDTKMPEVRFEKRFRPFVEDVLPGMLEKKKGYFAHPGSEKTQKKLLESQALLAIGPEGGWVPFEVDMLQKAGMQPLSLGERILRVETAVPVLIAGFLSLCEVGTGTNL